MSPLNGRLWDHCFGMTPNEQGGKTMQVPGFTAEASIYATNRQYRQRFVVASRGRSNEITSAQECYLLILREFCQDEYYPCVSYADGTIGWCSEYKCHYYFEQVPCDEFAQV